MKQEMDRIQKALRLHRTYIGFRYLICALDLALEDEDRLLSLKSIFALVAAKYQVRPHFIERDIRTIIARCWQPEFRSGLQQIAPFPLHGKPTVSEFLDILYWYLVNQSLE